MCRPTGIPRCFICVGIPRNAAPSAIGTGNVAGIRSETDRGDSTVVGQRVRAGDTAARTSSTRGPSEPVPTGIAVPVAKGAVVRGLGRSPAGQGHSPARLGWVRLDVRAGVDAGLERCCRRNRSGPGSRRRRGDRSGGRKLSVPWRTWILTGDMDGSRCRPRSVADGRSERPDQLA